MAHTYVSRPLVICWTLVKVAIAVVLVCWCALLLRHFDVYLPLTIPASTAEPGLVLLVCGAAIVLACGGILSTRGILRSEDPLFPKEFVASGPYKYVRNPMSLGMAALMLGLGFYKRSVCVLLFAAGLFLVLHLVAVYVEEPGLQKRFGASYHAYKQSVNRWIPRFKL
jgi:protein-S-isoprenylcysteine O-methyltransferase Ste14